MFLCSFHVLSPHLTVTSEKRPVSSNLFPSRIGSVSALPQRESHRLFYFSSEDKNLLSIAPVKFVAPAMPGGRVDDVILTGGVVGGENQRPSRLFWRGCCVLSMVVDHHWQLIFSLGGCNHLRPASVFFSTANIVPRLGSSPFTCWVDA
jgi:hypothetical protein